MPFADPEDRRRYDRERKRTIRAAARGEVISLPVAMRLQVAQDVEALLAEAVGLVRADRTARSIEKGRALGYLASIAL